MGGQPALCKECQASQGYINEALSQNKHAKIKTSNHVHGYGVKSDFSSLLSSVGDRPEIYLTSQLFLGSKAVFRHVSGDREGEEEGKKMEA